MPPIHRRQPAYSFCCVTRIKDRYTGAFGSYERQFVLLQQNHRILKYKGLKIGGVALLLTITLLLAFRQDVMRAAGSLLIVEDELQPADAIFVLSGNAFDRGMEAAKIFRGGHSFMIVCTGENIATDIKALGLLYTEGQITKIMVTSEAKVDSNYVVLLEKGTSTQEESDAILAYCQANQLKKIIVVSTKFHTRRVDNVFRDKFESAGIRVIIRGASHFRYDEDLWWENEYGLIDLNNEYIKMVYYWLKY